jgi:hypothetical protein
VRFFVYISDSKVDMLYAQIPSKLRQRIAGELKLDLKVLAVTLRELPSDENRYSRLTLLTNYLTREADIGTADAPEAYIQDTFEMTWGHQSVQDPLVYFAGETESSLVLLWGSAKHLVGSAPDPAMVGGGSLAPKMINAALGGLPLPVAADPPEIAAERLERLSSLARTAIERREGSVNRLEFLARRLVYRSATRPAGKVLLLGSPIYVAFAD